MDDALPEQQSQALDHGGGELLDERHRHALVVVFLDQLEQIQTAESHYRYSYKPDNTYGRKCSLLMFYLLSFHLSAAWLHFLMHDQDVKCYLGTMTL